MEIGKRIRELRLAYRLSAEDLKVNRTWLSKLENERVGLTLEMVERICAEMGVGLARMLCPDEQFDAMLAQEDIFVCEVRPFLKSLSEEQKKLILITLAAAPVSGPIRKRTSNESKSYTENKASTTSAPTSPIPSLRYPLSRKMKLESHRLQAF